MWKKVSITIGAVLVVLVLGFCFVPIKQVAYAVTEQCETTETYYVSEPYTEIETYYEEEPVITYETYIETEPYTISTPLDYFVTRIEGYNNPSPVEFYARVWIRNTDSYSGIFTVIFTLNLQGGEEIIEYVSKYIIRGETQKLQVSYEGAHLNYFTYTITPPTKDVTEYQEVEKTRELVEYREVEKTREVTRYQDVPKERTVWEEKLVTRYKRVSLLQYLLTD